MAQKQLTTNVFVPDVDDDGTARGSGTYYGPDYPENEVTAEVLSKITNPAAFEEVDTGFPVDPHSDAAAELRAAAAPATSAPVGDDELDDMSKPELLALAASRGVDVPARATKPEIIEALTAE